MASVTVFVSKSATAVRDAIKTSTAWQNIRRIAVGMERAISMLSAGSVRNFSTPRNRQLLPTDGRPARGIVSFSILMGSLMKEQVKRFHALHLSMRLQSLLLFGEKLGRENSIYLNKHYIGVFNRREVAL